MKVRTARSTAKLISGSSQISGFGEVNPFGDKKRGPSDCLFGETSGAFGSSEFTAHDAVIKGLSGKALTETVSRTARGTLSADAILKVLGVSARTAHRIRSNPDKPLAIRTADAVYRVESTRAMAELVLGSAEAASEWLNSESTGLDFRKPVELLSTSPGCESVKILLQRMRYGVYA